MFSRAALCAVLGSGLAAFMPAVAQVESESLDDISAWGQRYLSIGEPEFPSNLWRSSNDDTLLDLMQAVRTADLSPAERRLLRRTILSPATRPVGSKAEALLAERARLMLELGEARAAAALVPQLEEETLGLDAETLAVDLDMASGQELTACSKLDGPVRVAGYWLKLRAVCAVLQDNVAGAQIAIEVAEAQGVMDEWTVAAIFAASGDTPNPPEARYDSGLNIALSAKANLDTSDVELEENRPDLAAAAAQRPGVPADLRARLAQSASELGLIEAAERREILLTRLEDQEFEPSSEVEQALRDLNDPLVADADRAATLAAVLTNAADGALAEYRSTADLFLTDLEQMTQSADTGAYAIDFAQAALIAGNRDLAQAWLQAPRAEGIAPANPFRVAMLNAADVIAGGEATPQKLRAIEKRLISTANSTEREIQAANLFTLWAGLGIPLSPVARDFLAQTSDRGERLAQGQVTSLKAAAQAGAVGESALMLLAITQGETSALAGPDVSILLETLIRIGAEDIARDFALEVSGFWKEIE
nr:hypothetical protein [Hyphomonas sp. Mor2]